MLDKNDLQAISELMQQQKQEFSGLMQQQRQELSEMMQQQKQELSEMMDVKITASEERMKRYIEEKVTDETNRSIAYTEAVVEPRLDAIKEGLDLALETHIPIERIDRLETDVGALKSVVRRHSSEIDALKKAQ